MFAAHSRESERRKSNRKAVIAHTAISVRCDNRVSCPPSGQKQTRERRSDSVALSQNATFVTRTAASLLDT